MRIEGVLENRRHAGADGLQPVHSPVVNEKDEGEKLQGADEDTGSGKIALFAGFVQAPLSGLLGLLVFVRHELALNTQAGCRTRSSAMNKCTGSFQQSVGAGAENSG